MHWRNRLGLVAELIAAKWLIEQGFWTFIPVGGIGPIDLIAVSRSGQIHLFDVKSAARRKNGHIIARKLTTAQKLLKVKLLYVDVASGQVSVAGDLKTALKRGCIRPRKNTLENE